MTRLPAPMTPRQRRLFWLTVFVAVAFAAIGLRFIFTPESAARTFGVPSPATTEMQIVVGLRDLWLALLALALAYFREWRALALWFALGVMVCFSDAALATSVNAPLWAIAFHVGSGVLFVVLAASAWRVSRSP